MLEWTVTFLVVALVAGLLGFGGLAALSVEAAQIVFVVFISLFVITGVLHLFNRKTPSV